MKKTWITALLDKVAHVLPSGRPRRHSRFFAGSTSAAKLRWRCTGLSSSPTSIDDIYASNGKERSDGQKVRLIDIPVESGGSSGIFDLLEGSAPQNEVAVDEMIADLESALRRNHGVVIEPWVVYLAKSHPKNEVGSLIEEFVKSVVPTGSSVEKRLARKFGLVFAAGVLASRAKIVLWSKASIRAAVGKCFSRARSAAFGSKLHLGMAQSRLLGLLTDKSSIPLYQSGHIFKSKPVALSIFKTKHKSTIVLAISDKGLENIGGSPSVGHKLLGGSQNVGEQYLGMAVRKPSSSTSRLRAPKAAKCRIGNRDSTPSILLQ